MFEYEGNQDSIICCNDEISIKDLTIMICKISECNENEIICDLTKPEGCMRKTVDNSLFKKIYPDFKYTNLEEGLKYTINWFYDNYEKCRI